jgi:hypothetical protein
MAHENGTHVSISDKSSLHYGEHGVITSTYPSPISQLHPLYVVKYDHPKEPFTEGVYGENQIEKA